MAQIQNSMRSKLAVVRGLGSAKDGVHHWWMQRLTAIALIPLTVWLVGAFIGLMGAGGPVIAIWMAQPWHTILFGLFMLIGLYHGAIGMQVVVEDYVHSPFSKYTLLIGLKLLMWLTMAMTVYAVFKIALMH
ncbi:MAG: succinate dehydrogenase, hydrophobic membrane anchor protein [Alphaproteobacteria bacterium]|nr:MAG: succinate dehydrogenase, hydrophobic membrane anchor protein [Alphaproteobacteria bacterium]